MDVQTIFLLAWSKFTSRNSFRKLLFETQPTYAAYGSVSYKKTCNVCFVSFAMSLI